MHTMPKILICIMCQRYRAFAQMVMPTMTKCKVIETCLECSARTLTFVGEVRHSHTLQDCLQCGGVLRS